MLAQLSKGEANVSDLAKPFLKDMSLPADHEAPEGPGKSRPHHQNPRGAMASLQTQRQTHLRTWPTGWNSIEYSGKRVLIASMPI